MVRFIFLLGMLLSIALGGSGARDVVCIGDGHVSYDCHRLSQLEDCCDDADATEGADPASSSCIDLASPSWHACVVQADHLAWPLLFVGMMSPSPVDILPLTPEYSRDSSDDLPVFCARSYCSSIAIRC